jgi:hypothetical protein
MFRVPRFSQFVHSAERSTAVTANPNWSVGRLCLIRCRVLVEYLTKHLLYARFHHRALRATRRFRGAGSGNRALVIANGPSAGSLDLDRVAEEQKQGLCVFAINYYPLSEAAEKVKPDFLVLSDPVTRLSNTTDERTRLLWKSVRQETQTRLLVPTSWYQDLEADDGLLARAIFFNDIGLEGWTKNISPLRARGYLALTAYKALAFALFMSFDSVYIIGVDNSMFRTIGVTRENRLIQGAHHFFAAGGIETDVSDHFVNGIGDYFRDVSLCFSSLARSFSGSPVVNLDPQSLVDCFPKDSDNPLILGTRRGS